MKIVHLQYGESVLSEKMIFVNGDETKLRDIVFKVYLLITDEKYILIDAGCETMPGFEMKNFIGTVKALENSDISTDKITDVIITHAHHDHIECVKYFKNATIHIQKDEYVRGMQYIPDEIRVNLFEDEYEFSSYLKIIKIGGHSKGSCIVEINKENKTFVIVGDECYLKECLINKIPTGSSFNQDASRRFIEKYSEPQYDILLCHDN